MRSTLRAPSKRSDAVIDDTICPINRFRFVYVGRSIDKFRRQISCTQTSTAVNYRNDLLEPVFKSDSNPIQIHSNPFKWIQILTDGL